MGETLVQFLGWEDPLEKGKATHSSILAWKIPWTVHGVAKSWMWLSNFHFTFTFTETRKSRVQQDSPQANFFFNENINKSLTKHEKSMKYFNALVLIFIIANFLFCRAAGFP